MFVVSMIWMLCGEKSGDGAREACEEVTTAPSEELKFADMIDKVMHSKVMAELKALPSEIRESLILHVERQSLVVAGVLVAIGAAVLLLGCFWIHWCHTEYVEYVPISHLDEAEQRLHRAKHSNKHNRHKHSGVHQDQPETKQDSKAESKHEGMTIVHRRTHSNSNSHIANGGQQ